MFRALLEWIISLIFPIKSSLDRLYAQYQTEVVLKSLKSRGSNVRIEYPARIKNAQYISIGNNFHSLYNLRIEAWDSYGDQRFEPEIVIGDNVSLNTDVHIGCIKRVVIGDNVLMASRIYISDHFHGDAGAGAFDVPPGARPLVSRGPVIILKNVWIGEGACIMPGVTIGENAIIGANSVVTKNIPANSVVAGVPAIVIRTIKN